MSLMQQSIETSGCDMVTVAVRRVQTVAAGHAGLIQRLLHAVQQNVLVDRLGQEVERATLGGCDRFRNGAVGREQDHRQGGAIMAQALEQIDAVHAVHAQIGDHAVRGIAFQGAQRGSAAFSGFDMMTRAFQAQREQAAQAGVVID